MKQSASRKPMSPVNIDQNRAVGLDSFAEGSRMGREADKAHGFPGEAEQFEAGSRDAPAQGEDAIRYAAYEAYQRRSAAGAAGSETDDWLEAEERLKRQPSD